MEKSFHYRYLATNKAILEKNLEQAKCYESKWLRKSIFIEQFEKYIGHYIVLTMHLHWASNTINIGI